MIDAAATGETRIQACRVNADWKGVRKGFVRLVTTGMILVCALTAAAQTRSGMMTVRVVVTRSCAVDPRPGNGSTNPSVTCSRGTTPAPVSTTTTTTTTTPAPVQRSTTAPETPAARTPTSTATPDVPVATTTTTTTTTAVVQSTDAAVTAAPASTSASADASAPADQATGAAESGGPTDPTVIEADAPAAGQQQAGRRVELVTINF